MRREQLLRRTMTKPELTGPNPNYISLPSQLKIGNTTVITPLPINTAPIYL